MAMCESIDGQRVFDPQQTGLHLVASDIHMNYAITANDLVTKFIQEQVMAGNLRHRAYPTSSVTMPTDEQTTKQFDDHVSDMYESYAKRMNHMSFGKANSEGSRTLVGPTLNTLCEGVSACPIILQDTWAQVTSVVGYNHEPTAGLSKKIPVPKGKVRGRNPVQQDMLVSDKQALLVRAAKEGVNMVLTQNDQGDSSHCSCRQMKGSLPNLRSSNQYGGICCASVTCFSLLPFVSLCPVNIEFMVTVFSVIVVCVCLSGHCFVFVVCVLLFLFLALLARFCSA